MKQIIECRRGICYEKIFDDYGNLIYDGSQEIAEA